MSETTPTETDKQSIEELLDIVIKSTVTMARCSLQSEILDVAKSLDILVRLREEFRPSMAPIRRAMECLPPSAVELVDVPNSVLISRGFKATQIPTSQTSSDLVPVPGVWLDALYNDLEDLSRWFKSRHVVKSKFSKQFNERCDSLLRSIKNITDKT